MRRSGAAALLILLAFGALAFGAGPVSAGTYSHTVSQGECVRVGSVNGGGWSMTSTAPFQGIVRASNGPYSYGPRIATDHAGTGPAGANVFYTACNVCPVGTITVDFTIPEPAINQGAADRFAAGATDTTGCDSALPGGFDFDAADIPEIVGNIGVGIAVLVILIVIALPAPVAPAPGPAANVVPFNPRPRLLPVGWTNPVAGPAKVMARGTEQLNPTDWIGVTHPVPADAPQQAVAGTFPVGSRINCPACGQLTLTLFQQGWFCTNLQCPLRPPGAGQTTTFVYMNF